jgi:hypothetical protein
METRWSFPGPGREAAHSPPSGAEVKEWVELYVHSPSMPSWRGVQLKKAQGQFYLLALLYITFVVKNALYKGPGEWQDCAQRQDTVPHLISLYSVFSGKWRDRILKQATAACFPPHTSQSFIPSQMEKHLCPKLSHCWQQWWQNAARRLPVACGTVLHPD